MINTYEKIYLYQLEKEISGKENYIEQYVKKPDIVNFINYQSFISRKDLYFHFLNQYKHMSRKELPDIKIKTFSKIRDDTVKELFFKNMKIPNLTEFMKRKVNKNKRFSFEECLKLQDKLKKDFYDLHCYIEEKTKNGYSIRFLKNIEKERIHALSCLTEEDKSNLSKISKDLTVFSAEEIITYLMEKLIFEANNNKFDSNMDFYQFKIALGWFSEEEISLLLTTSLLRDIKYKNNALNNIQVYNHNEVDILIKSMIAEQSFLVSDGSYVFEDETLELIHYLGLKISKKEYRLLANTLKAFLNFKPTDLTIFDEKIQNSIVKFSNYEVNDLVRLSKIEEKKIEEILSKNVVIV